MKSGCDLVGFFVFGFQTYDHILVKGDCKLSLESHIESQNRESPANRTLLSNKHYPRLLPTSRFAVSNIGLCCYRVPEQRLLVMIGPALLPALFSDAA